MASNLKLGAIFGNAFLGFLLGFYFSLSLQGLLMLSLKGCFILSLKGFTLSMKASTVLHAMHPLVLVVSQNHCYQLHNLHALIFQHH